MEKVRIKPSTLHREVDGEPVLVNLDTGTRFGLDEVGSEIWTLLGEGYTLEEIPARLTGLYDVSERAALRELSTLLEDLVESGLVERARA